jgi:hypothetical protein
MCCAFSALACREWKGTTDADRQSEGKQFLAEGRTVGVFRQLEYFVALAREQHFAKAAQVRFVSQPALSEAIRKLEHELDVPLVNRGRAFEGLTPEGERLVIWARGILADHDALKQEVVAMRSGLEGQLRLAVIPAAAKRRRDPGYAEGIRLATSYLVAVRTTGLSSSAISPLPL